MTNRIKINDNLFIERKKNDLRSNEQIKKQWLINKSNSNLSIKLKEKTFKL